MPVVSKRSNLIRRPQFGDAMIDPLLTGGRLRIMHFTVANAADDSSGSKYHLCDLPSSAIMFHITAFDVTNWGFAGIRIGTETTVDALVSVLKSAGNTVSPIAIGDTRYGKRVWEQLGLTADPNRPIGLYAHAIAGATGAGSMRGHIALVHN